MSKIDYNSGEYIIIYVYSLPDVTTHRNHLKIGKTNIKLSDYALAEDKEKAVQDAAHKRIGGDLRTSEVNYILEYCTLAIKADGNSFMDYDVHNVLKRSNIPNIVHNDKKYGEWFETSIDTAKNAIDAVKNNQQSLRASDIVSNPEVSFRKGSQTDAIYKTLKAIGKGKKHFLWDAKMRFGKTLTALEIARQMNYGKVLIITHRPEVNEDWFNDFNKLFTGTDYKFGSKNKGENITNLQNSYLKSSDGHHANPFVYFASIQYLRHEIKSNEKIAILNEKWDMLIVDEADEGIKTTLANETIQPIQRDFTLMLSGTPFNLLEDYNEDEIYSWDYTAEQELKEKWEELYPNEPNPYYKLPKLSIFIYDLNKYIPNNDFKDIYDKAFNFKEFFRTDESGDFIHERHVVKFLDLISTKSNSNFPYSTEEFRTSLRHTLWMVPGVKEARALENLLNNHPVFRQFKIANVAGDGNEEVAEKKSRDLVKQAITSSPMDNYSITISCGKMTRGVSVPEWSAVFMLSNTSSASTYLQTIFRSQTPWEYEGRLKTECFVFDFAPDRTLNVVAEVMNIKKKKPTADDIKEATGKFLNFCPVISATDGEMKPFSAQKLLHAIKKVAIQRVTRNGFDDTRLYNLENLSKCSDEELEDFALLNNIIGNSSGNKVNDSKVKMADNGFTEEEREKAENAEKKKKEKLKLTPEEEEFLRRKKEIAEQRKTRISILRGISIRMPMLIYGCKIDQNGNEIKADDEIGLNQFIENIDDESWIEFMPEGVSKSMLREKFAKYYDDEVFIGAGIDIRLRALAADYLAPSERVTEIGEIFKGFKNPDKETVLTPWKVVNHHISSTLGGSDFNDIIDFDANTDQKNNKLGLPNWVDQGEVTKLWNNKDARVLEINSKSGLYPLLCAYNFYTQALPDAIKGGNITEEDVFGKLWNNILSNNIFVLCKSPMAKTITERTLAGYTNTPTNVVYIPNIINKFKDDNYNLSDELFKQFDFKGDENMKFDVVVGNPPYQEQKGGTKNIDIWHHFIFNSLRVSDKVVTIHPARWVVPKKQMTAVRDKLIESGLKKFDYYPNSSKLFSSVAIDGGVTITVVENKYSGKIEYSIEGEPFGFYTKNTRFISNKFEDEIINIFNPILSSNKTMLDRIIGNIGSIGGSEYGYSKVEHSKKLHASERGLNRPVKIWANSGSGKGTRFSWHYVEKNDLGTIPTKILSTRKVMLDKKGHALTTGKGNIFNNIPTIVDKNSIASGDVLFVLPEQDQDYHLDLIKSLFMTKTARFLMSITQKDLYVRGFENIPDYTLFIDKLKTKKFTDQWFYEEFKFSDELVQHIETLVSPKDQTKVHKLAAKVDNKKLSE